MHRDLKSPNLLVDRNWDCKVSILHSPGAEWAWQVSSCRSHHEQWVGRSWDCKANCRKWCRGAGYCRHLKKLVTKI